jgi:predicted nuclease of predicted toxin-antitoxin system
MPEKIRFHLDENVEGAIAEGLKQKGIDVTTTPEMGLLNASDKEQVAFALAQGRVIFTHDADFLRLHQAGFEHFGIVYARQGRRLIGEILRVLLQIWESQSPESMRQHIEFV